MPRLQTVSETEFGKVAGPVPGALPARQIAPSPNGELGQPDLSLRLVVKTGSVTLEVVDVRESLRRVEGMAVRMGGYVESSSASYTGGRMAGLIMVRIPAERFSAALDEIGQLGKVKDMRTASEDVTLQFIDLRARLSNLQREENRLLEILSTAKTTDELLKLERELYRVRTEIERITGQINYIERNVKLSTITAHVSEPTPTPLPSLDWSAIWSGALVALYAVVKGMVVLAIGSAPVLAIGVPILLAVRHLLKK